MRWNYKIAFLRCALLLAAGATLQFVSGDIRPAFLHHPWGTVLAANYLYLLVLAYALSDRYRWLRTLWDDKACISSLASVLVLVIISGFSRITASWPFNMMLFYFMTVLGIRLVSEICSIRHLHKDGSMLRHIGRTATHAGVFLLLWAGIFGSGDTFRGKVAAHLGHPVSTAVDSGGDRVSLPFSVTLQEFLVEEYPPKLYILDTQTSEISDEFLLAESDGAVAEVGEWRLRADTCLSMAGCMPGDTVYREMEHTGAAHAVFVTGENRRGQTFSGWVSCGSHIFNPSSLELPGGKMVVMPPPEARRYLSRVEIEDADGSRKKCEIEVNHPARYGSWRIYQTGYDTSRGRWSTVSVLECVRDPWYFISHAALWLLLAAGAVMFVASGGQKRSGGKNDGRI